MLTTLRIKNLALVEDLTLELQPGYNVITGETGAGKSILIGALNLVLGERADRTLIRSGAESCTVEATLDVSRLQAPLKSFLDENGLEPCEDQHLVLKRSFTNSGTNRQFINGTATTLAVLSSVGQWLVDIHGPHEHQSLLQPGRQLDLLDAFGKLEPERESFRELVRKRSELLQERAVLIVDERTYAQQLDLLRFQAQEIEAARLQPGEEDQLEQEYGRSTNAAKLVQLAQAALDALGEGDTALLNQAGIVGRLLQDLQRVDATSSPLTKLHEQAVASLRELQIELSRYADKVDVNPRRLAELEERVNLVQSLKRKYGTSLAEVVAFGEDARQKLQKMEAREGELQRIKADLQKNEAELLRVGRLLTNKRRKTIPLLSKAVSRQLSELGFKQSRFDAELTTIDPAAAPHNGAETARFPQHGFDTVDFQFAPNPGEPARPLCAIASSGELARVMLAIKTVLASEDRVPVLVFDEVDANVGGETAHAVGEKMKQIALNRQVLCITHLPQVAAPATAHFVAAKETRDGRTISEIRRLERKERVTELARMLGGQTEPARQHAAAMLK
ncbi:MAG TPA: DNA repair protein RecN [Candidatus Dormibacteraeota bacterium]|nr:DNA repair protein RecN [Candidatus Dormibacteraeota bacterium]